LHLEAGDRALEMFTLSWRAAVLGTTRWSTSDTRRELERLTARFPGEPIVERVLGLWRAFSAYEEGRPEEARALTSEWLAQVRRHDSPVTAESFALFFARKELLLGEVERAERLALDAVERLQEFHLEAFLCTAKVILAGVRVAQGRFREALELANEGERVGGAQDRQNLVAASAVRARAYAQLGEPEQAKAAAAEAIAVAEQTDSLSAWAVAQQALAEALLAAGELPAARAAATEAKRLLATLERPLARAAASELVEQIDGRRASTPTTPTST
jgi:ATP/maltotriose-dependent transcriptional regulator MalT